VRGAISPWRKEHSDRIIVASKEPTKENLMGFSFYSPRTDEYISQVEKITSLLEDTILPKFNDIEEQSERASDEAWEEAMNQPATEDCDPSDFVEAAVGAGVSTYQILTGLRQGMINFFVAAIYQCFEQQLQEFHSINPYRFSLLRVCYKTDVKTWKEIHRELRLVANTAKHGKGKSSEELRKIRRDLFRPPAGEPVSFDPMFGNQLYVTIHDLRHYRDLIVNFWKEYTEILDKKEETFGSGGRSP